AILVMCMLLVLYSSSKVLPPAGNAYCNTIRGDACLKECGCGMCHTNGVCYSSDYDQCDPKKWAPVDTADCGGRRESAALAIDVLGYIDLALVCFLVVLGIVYGCDAGLDRLNV